MLCTTEESLEENQPLANENQSLVLVMDGWLDNWTELRKELLAHDVLLRDRTDAELVLRAYELWAYNCLTHLSGDFALVIWDAERRKVFCARDRVGSKPFYYHRNNTTLVFSSEPHPILALPWVREELNQPMLAEFLGSEWWSRDQTLWTGIMRLMAAHRMDVCANKLELAHYWMPDCSAKLPYTNDEEFVEHYRELFTDVVRRMSRSHKPLGCEVSGGLDSSAIFAVAESLSHEGKLVAPSLDGYTLDFHDDEAANELEYARAVGEFYGKKIHEIEPSIQPLSWYRHWANHYQDLPPYPNGSMGLGIRSAAVTNGSRVLMNGVGGDEWLWGDRGYYAELIANSEWQELIDCLKVDSADVGIIRCMRWLLLNGIAPLLPNLVEKPLRKVSWIVRDRRHGIQKWLTPSMRSSLRLHCSQYDDYENVQRVSPGLRAQLSTLHDAFGAFATESEERMAASVGIEMRRPLWHPTMIQFAFSTPTQFRLRGSLERVIHRRAMAGLLPESVLQRRSKANFMITLQIPLAEFYSSMDEADFDRFSSWVDTATAYSLWKRQGLAESGAGAEFRLWSLLACSVLADEAGNLTIA